MGVEASLQGIQAEYISAVGTSEQTSQKCTSTESKSVSLSLLSLQANVSILSRMVSFMTIWRDVQAEKVKRRKQWKSVHVPGLDGAYVLGRGRETTCVGGYRSGNR